MRKIVSLEVENVKRVSVVEIKPDGSPLVVIGGKNGAGKSSVLDSIVYALQGKGAMPSKPVRTGEDSAEIVVELDGDPPLIVKRKIKKDGRTTVEVSQLSNGITSKVSSPQKLLDSLVGRISFDPLAFTRMKPRDQVEMLKDLVGVSTDEIDSQEKQLFDERTSVNRQHKDLLARFNQMPVHPRTDRVEMAELLRELNAAENHNKRIRSEKLKAEEIHNSLVRQEDDIKNRYKTEVVRLEDELEQAKERLAAACKVRDEIDADYKQRVRELESQELIDTDPVMEQIKNAEGVNRICREIEERNRVNEEVKAVKKKSDELTKGIESSRKAKLKLMSEAKWPVDGLGFGTDGVTFGELPFEQCSSAEQLRISTAIGLACNPELNVMMIRDGSLLDSDSMQIVSDIASQSQAQVWVERVSDGEECSVVIEDGAVQSPIKE